MERFSDIRYERPDMTRIKAEARDYVEALKKAVSYEEMKARFLDYKKKQSSWNTMMTVASIRNTADTNDAYYAEEMKYFHQETPEAELIDKMAEKVILDCPYRKEWEEEFGDFFLKNMEMSQKLSDESILQDLVEEADLCQQYSRISASASTVFRGTECNFYGLLKHMQSTDRQERKEAMMAWGDLYAKIAPELDGLYDKMVPLRVGIAKKLGFDSYIDFAYLKHGRYDYKAEDVANFRKQVKDVIVPVCQKLREQQAERLGLPDLHYYDEALIFPEGNAVPIGNKDELVEKARVMYHDISKESGEFFEDMVKYDLFDLETKKGKRPGGYCTFLEEYKMPFIFSNFNGTSADVDVLTHEAGHSFNAYAASRNLTLMDMVFPTSEIAEIHSMTMEHFAYPYMERFFGEKAAQYRYAHLMEALQVIPYMVCVDEFQHRVFEKPEMTAAERRAVWHSLEENYLPWRDYDGHPFLTEGGFWMQKQHIFLFPFYYIDYALAQMGAFEFYGRMKKDHKEAWESYYELCKAGGSKGYFELLGLAGLSNPFREGTVEKIVESLKEDLF